MPEAAKTSGFTLALDGDPEEVQRILDAVFREYQKIEEEAWRRESAAFRFDLLGAAPTLPRHSLRGRIDLRYDADSVLSRAAGG